VRWLGKITALVLLALWVPVTAHCSLERLTNSTLLACCCEEDSEPSSDQDCQQEICSVLEAGLVKKEEGHIFLIVPDPCENPTLISSDSTPSALLHSFQQPTDRAPMPSVWPRWLRTVQPPLGPTAL